MKTFTRSILFVALAAAAVPGCALDNPNAPPVVGPSTFGVSLNVTASPDILPEDGASQSVVKVTVRDAMGQPLRNVPLRFDVIDGGKIVDFGVLSARNVTTNNNGEASVVFTAPRAAIRGFDSGTIVQIVATPIGTDWAGATAGSVQIRLVPESIATIPGAPTPTFSFTPSNPGPGDLITFNASASTDDGTIVRYRWTFSDGHVEPDQAVVSHDFTDAGVYFVTLTVTDNENKSSSVTRAVTVSGG